MRTKDEILDDANRDITRKMYKADAGFWLDVRKIEIQIDIRDILKDGLDHIISAILNISLRP